MRHLPLLALLCALPLPALAQDSEDEGFLTDLIEDNLSATARDVDIQGFAGALSSRATIERLTIADGEGVWLEATDLVLDWNRSALLRGRLEVEELTAGTIAVLRPPIPDPQAPTPEATPFSLPDLPVSVEIGDLAAQRIILGEPLLGEELVLTLDGSVNLSGGEGEAEILAEIVEGSDGRLALTGSYSNDSRVLSLNLDVQEEAGGLVARALDIPDLPSVSLQVEGTAPIDDYAAEIRLATGGEPRLSGDFALKTTAQENGQVTSRAFGLDVEGDVTPLLAPEVAEFLGPDIQLRTKGIRREDGSLVLTSLGIQAEALELNGRAEITPQGWPARLDLQGSIGREGGEPVPLPGVADTLVDGVTLNLDYDRAQGESWTGTFAIDGFQRPGLTIDTLSLDGSGTIQPAIETQPGSFTADLDYAAQGLAFADAAVAEALGADLSGNIDLVRSADGGPLQIESLTLSGPGLQAQAEGTVAGADQSFLTGATVTFQAEDLARFAELSGLDLGGSADATLDASVRPLDGIFDLTLSGTTQDLALGIPQIDPYLAGSGEVALSAARDTAGLRIENLDLSTEAVTATGTADITSGASQAQFDLSVDDLGRAFPDLSGPATIQGSFDRAATGEATLDAEASLSGATVSLDATQAASTPGPEGEEPVPGSFTFDVQAQVAELAPYQGLLETFGLALTPAGAADLSLSGTAEADLSAFDVTVSADTEDLALGLDQVDPLLAGDGTLSGRIARTGPAAFRVEDLTVSTDLLDGTVTANLTEGGGTAEIDLSLSDVEPVLGGLSGPGRVTGTAIRAADGSFDLDLDASLPTGTASLDGTLAPPDQGYAFTGDVSADFDDIAPLGTLLGRDLGGAVQADASGTLLPDLSTFDLTLDATTQDLATGIPQLDPLLDGEGTLSGRIARTGSDSFVAENLLIDTPLLDGTVSADISEGTGSAEIDLSLADVEPVLGGISGPGRLSGTVSTNPDGTLDLDLDTSLPTGTATIDGILRPDEGYAFTGDLSADLSDIAPLGTLVGRDLGGAIEAEASGTVSPDLSALDLSFDVATQDLRTGLPQIDPLLGGQGRVSGTAARTEDGSYDLDIDTSLPIGTASLDGTLSLGDVTAFTGDITTDLADIAPLGPLLGRDLGGALQADASGTFTSDLSQLDLTFDAATRDLRTGLPQLDPLLAGPGTFSGQVERAPAGDLALSLSADTPQITGEAAGTFTEDSGQGRFDIRLPDVSLVAPGLSGPATAIGTASRAADGSIVLDAQATAPGASADIDATIAPPEQGYEITGTADVSADNLAPFSDLAGRPLSGAIDANVTGSALPSLQRFDLTVDATTQDLGLGIPQLDQLLAGSGGVSGRVIQEEGAPLRAENLQASFPNISLTADGSPEGLSFDARLADLGLFVPEFPGPVTATGTASFAGDATQIDAQVTGPGGISAQVTGSVGETTDLSATGTAPLGLANAFLEPRRLAGDANFELSLAGEPSLDNLSGTVTVQDARLADPTLGEAVTDIDGTATITGGTAQVDLTGALATGGRISVAGPVSLLPPFEADLAIDGTGLVIRDPSLYEAFGSADLTVTGPLAGGALISGTVNLDTVEMRVPSSSVGALGEIPDIFHIEPSVPVQRTLARADLASGAGGDGTEPAEEPGPGFALDILLNAPNQVFIRGRGLDAELGGTLRLTGTTDQVIPIGQFSLIRGRLSILGQRFDLTEGQATIQGDFNPYLRLVAQTEARTGTLITIRLEGPLSAPEVTFSSTPELPQDEVIAQLLFGVDLESLTPLQAVRLASAVATLAGEGTGLLDDIRGEAGLADFDITTTESGELGLRLGRYLSENIYTDVVVAAEETEVTINLDLTPDLTVRAGVDTEGETTLGIYYEKDY